MSRFQPSNKSAMRLRLSIASDSELPLWLLPRTAIPPKAKHLDISTRLIGCTANGRTCPPFKPLPRPRWDGATVGSGCDSGGVL